MTVSKNTICAERYRSENVHDWTFLLQPEIRLTLGKIFMASGHTCSEYINYIIVRGSGIESTDILIVLCLLALYYNLQTYHARQGLDLYPHHQIIAIFPSSLHFSLTVRRRPIQNFTCITLFHTISFLQ
jgi:hypothetical protein